MTPFSNSLAVYVYLDTVSEGLARDLVDWIHSAAFSTSVHPICLPFGSAPWSPFPDHGLRNTLRNQTLEATQSNNADKQTNNKNV